MWTKWCGDGLVAGKELPPIGIWQGKHYEKEI